MAPRHSLWVGAVTERLPVQDDGEVSEGDPQEACGGRLAPPPASGQHAAVVDELEPRPARRARKLEARHRPARGRRQRARDLVLAAAAAAGLTGRGWQARGLGLRGLWCFVSFWLVGSALLSFLDALHQGGEDARAQTHVLVGDPRRNL